MILLYATDLIFTTRIRAEAGAAGASVQVARGLDSLRAKLEGLPAEVDRPAGEHGDRPTGRGPLMIVDLDADDAVAAVRLASGCSPSLRVVAFVSHVRADLARTAREAGADEVLARSAFVQRLPELAKEAIT